MERGERRRIEEEVLRFRGEKMILNSTIEELRKDLQDQNYKMKDIDDEVTP